MTAFAKRNLDLGLINCSTNNKVLPANKTNSESTLLKRQVCSRNHILYFIYHLIMDNHSIDLYGSQSILLLN